MNYITKSLPAMILLSAAAMLLILGEAFNVAAYASLTPTSLGVANDLSQAGDWLAFTAVIVGLLALGTAAWATVLAKNWAAVAELGVGIAGVIIIAVGDLVNAATSENSASTANILQAIGFGILALLVLGHAAQRSLAEQDVSARPRQAALWLAAAAGLATFAVGVSFDADRQQQGPRHRGGHSSRFRYRDTGWRAHSGFCTRIPGPGWQRHRRPNSPERGIYRCRNRGRYVLRTRCRSQLAERSTRPAYRSIYRGNHQHSGFSNADARRMDASPQASRPGTIWPGHATSALPGVAAG